MLFNLGRANAQHLVRFHDCARRGQLDAPGFARNGPLLLNIVGLIRATKPKRSGFGFTASAIDWSEKPGQVTSGSEVSASACANHRDCWP
jgi:hypothetical protein